MRCQGSVEYEFLSCTHGHAQVCLYCIHIDGRREDETCLRQRGDVQLMASPYAQTMTHLGQPKTRQQVHGRKGALLLVCVCVLAFSPLLLLVPWTHRIPAPGTGQSGVGLPRIRACVCVVELVDGAAAQGAVKGTGGEARSRGT
jgi:hypothetical protein